MRRDSDGTIGTDGALLAGFPFALATFAGTGEFRRYELLVGTLRDSLMSISLLEANDATAVESLRRFFLTMVETAILRSPGNRP